MNKEQARSWLFELLAKVESCQSVTGSKQESGTTVTVKLDFQSKL